MGKERLNIGLLISEYGDIFAREVCVGAMKAAEEIDANLYIMAGGYFDAPYMERNKSKYEYQNNYIFNFATEKSIDVLIVLLGTIASNVDEKAQKKFMDQYKGIPVLTIANQVESYPNVSFDNKGGFAKEVDYLINVLGKKKIGIVCGPETNDDSIERLDAYKEVLEQNGIAIDDKKIVYGNFSEYSEDAVEKLLDNNKDLDAIVFANDYMALCGYKIMKERGIQPGKDVAVMGFDDSPFASRMEPGLTTTRADSRELGYRAVMEAIDLEVGDDRDIRLETTLIIRDSCGNRRNGATNRIEDLLTLNVMEMDAKTLTGHIRECLLDVDVPSEAIGDIDYAVEKLVDWLCNNISGKSITDDLYHQVSEHFVAMCIDIMTIVDNMNLVFEICESLLLIFSETLATDKDRVRMCTVLAECYKKLFVSWGENRDSNRREIENINRITMTIMRDLVDEDEQTENYDVLLSRMYQMGYKKSYILLFPQVIRCRKNGRWKKPTEVLLKAYQKGRSSHAIPEDEQKLSVDDLFRIAPLEDNKRKTYAVAFLFSKDEQYGMFMVEPDFDNLISIEAIAFQVSSAIQTMHLFQSKEDVSAKLAESLEQLKETNAFLDEVSKSDELTQIYNRRGFLVTARRVMKEPENIGRNAVVIYADMNNLKLINDKFGHEEGDYSLRSIATILKEALGEHEIIGRMGGDEFAAFLFMEDKKYEQMIRNRINEATEKLNAGNDKPYYISMSVGISAFKNDGEVRMNDAMVRADVDLYMQKKHKRNKILK